MKKKAIVCLTLIFIKFFGSCGHKSIVQIPEHHYTETVIFNDLLSSYNIYEGELANISPAPDFSLLELSSSLFTDYSTKQRLIKLPLGYQLQSFDDKSFNFPDETILVKTFYYLNDLRDATLGKRIIETRLLIKSKGIWNSATYIWNDNQLEARLYKLGSDAEVSWMNEDGHTVSTLYHIPDRNECFACHQSDSNLVPLGTTPVNLNKKVLRDGAVWNQLEYLQSIDILSSNIDPTFVSTMVDYKEPNSDLSERARAYLHMNCSHCHNPSGWEEANEFSIDFRFQTDFNSTGIEDQANKIKRITSNGRMPYIGTTLFDIDGIAMLTEYIENL